MHIYAKTSKTAHVYSTGCFALVGFIFLIANKLHEEYAVMGF